MKKVLLVAAVAGLAMVSCKKDYVCECSNTSTMAGAPTTTTKHTVVEVSKGRAKAGCASTSSEYTFGGTTYVNTSTCEIK